MNTKAFKVCSMCSKIWVSRDEFLDDKTLKLNGYHADFEKLECGLFYFTHNVEACYSTLAIEAKDFLDLYSGKKYTEIRAGKDGCPRYCLEKEQLSRCNVHCECAFNREVMQIIKERQNSK